MPPTTPAPFTVGTRNVDVLLAVDHTPDPWPLLTRVRTCRDCDGQGCDECRDAGATETWRACACVYCAAEFPNPVDLRDQGSDALPFRRDAGDYPGLCDECVDNDNARAFVAMRGAS